MNGGRSGLRGDVVFASVLALSGLVVAIQSLVYGIMDENRLGPGAVPFIAGVALCIAATTIAVGALRHGPQDEGGETGLSDVDAEIAAAAAEAEAPGAGSRSVAIFGLLAGALLVSQVIGLVPAAVLFVFVTGVAVERLPVVKALILAGVAALMIWAIFILLLDIPF
jgi:putative tricarboxylic transport membrane protein